jgi:hypothetical protein
MYNHHAEIRPGVPKMDPAVLWAGAATVTAAWLASFLYFAFWVAEPKLRHTLWSTTSGRQAVQRLFFNGKTDQDKFNVFRRNKWLWESDIGKEVKAWTAENWARWKEEAGVWFKPELVPDSFIPVEELEQLGYNRKRRGSAAGSIRESFRETGGVGGGDGEGGGEGEGGRGGEEGG